MNRKPPYTARQGQFLAFIHRYMLLYGCAPSEVDMVDFFRVAPPTVHQMVLILERNGCIQRTPGQVRSIRIILPPEALPQPQHPPFSRHR